MFWLSLPFDMVLFFLVGRNGRLKGMRQKMEVAGTEGGENSTYLATERTSIKIRNFCKKDTKIITWYFQ